MDDVHIAGTRSGDAWLVRAKDGRAEAGPMARERAEEIVAAGHLARAWGDLEIVRLPRLVATREQMLSAYLELWGALDVVAKRAGLTDAEAMWLYTGQSEAVWNDIRELKMEQTRD